MRFEYYTRLTIVGTLLLSCSLGIGVIALLPSYIDVLMELDTQMKEIEARQENVENNKALNMEVSETAALIELLHREQTREKTADFIDEVLYARPEGVTVVGYTYDRTKRSISINGIATSRDLVVSYAKKLEEKARFSSVPVPIADLAKNKNLTFRLQVKLEEE